MKTRGWRDNAHEFKALSRQGYGVRLALLVACSVGEGSGKVSVREFAEAAGVNQASIRECVKKWDRLVKAGWDLPRDQLTPAMVDLDGLLPEGFIEAYEKMTEGRPAYRHLSKQRLGEAILEDPEYRKAAEAALNEHYRSKHPQLRSRQDDAPERPDYWLLSDAHAALFEFVKSQPGQALLGHEIVRGFRAEMREMLDELDAAEAGRVLLNADEALERWAVEATS
jgi:AcrR family transcriptional regulator